VAICYALAIVGMMNCNRLFNRVVPTESRSDSSARAAPKLYRHSEVLHHPLEYLARVGTGGLSDSQELQYVDLAVAGLVGADEALRPPKPPGDFVLAQASLFAGVPQSRNQRSMGQTSNTFQNVLQVVEHNYLIRILDYLISGYSLAAEIDD